MSLVVTVHCLPADPREALPSSGSTELLGSPVFSQVPLRSAGWQVDGPLRKLTVTVIPRTLSCHGTLFSDARAQLLLGGTLVSSRFSVSLFCARPFTRLLQPGSCLLLTPSPQAPPPSHRRSASDLDLGSWGSLSLLLSPDQSPHLCLP